MAQLKDIKQIVSVTNNRVFMALHDSLEDAWFLMYNPHSTDHRELIYTQRGTMKRYSTLDALESDCRYMAGTTFTLEFNYSYDVS